MTRSPAYPGIPVDQAVDLVSKVYQANRTNPVDREAAARDMGFRGMTGSSSKALADLAHYGLVDRAGKGSVRVTQLAVDILYPASPTEKLNALEKAAFTPTLFSELRKQFPDGTPSGHNLHTYLMRSGFATSAVPLAVNSYRETCRIVQEAGANESHGKPTQPASDSGKQGKPTEPNVQATPASPKREPEGHDPVPTPSTLNKINMNIAEDIVHLNAVLDYRGLSLLEKKIANLKALMAPEDDIDGSQQKPN